jgi:hypothetical protein
MDECDARRFGLFIVNSFCKSSDTQGPGGRDEARGSAPAGSRGQIVRARAGVPSAGEARGASARATLLTY